VGRNIDVFDLEQSGLRRSGLGYGNHEMRCYMLQMAAIFHIFIGSTLAGVFVIAALILGYDSLTPILIAAGIGFAVSFPVTWVVAKMVYRP
jgi:uncharacterized protein with PQ loop repeat